MLQQIGYSDTSGFPRGAPAASTAPLQGPVRRVRLLEADVGLGSALAADQLDSARRFAVAEVVELGRGHQHLSTVGTPDMLGLLVVQGLMIRSVSVSERSCGAELVGPGALLRPCDQDGQAAPVPFDVHWRVIEPVHLALLDRRVTLVCARWPTLLHELLRRAVERSHTLAFNATVNSLQHVELRLLVILWHLADRFGRVTADGTVVPVRLTHRDLAQLVGCTRPAASGGLARLADQTLVSRRPDRTWLLHGEPPQELHDRRIRAAA